VLFFIHLGSRKVYIAGVTPHPNEAWMVQVARNVTMEEWGFLSPGQYLLHDRDRKYCPAFQQRIDAAGVTRVPLPPRSPNLNAYAERWVRSIKEECLSRMILFGEMSLCHVLTQYVEHYHHERNHQGKGNVLLFPTVNQDPAREGPMQCRERLGGLLKYYTHEAAWVFWPYDHEPEAEASDAPTTAKARMAAKVRTPEGKAVYARRKVIVEPVFGQIKEGRGFRRFLLRGLQNIRGEWRLVCLTHNLLKLWRYGRSLNAG
jgi:DDE family transposase/integrase-like protein